ncbi:MAG: amino acid ABC transporter permease [Candidatus Promineifilaceae bacterium]|jgi:polar amino acid transport system permease protein
MTGPEIQTAEDQTWEANWREFPWWLLAIFTFLGVMAFLIATRPNYNEAFHFIRGKIEIVIEPGTFELLVEGFWMTLKVTLTAFAIALVLGLLAGLGRISHNTFIRNLAMTYIEFIRGVPTLVLIFTLAFVIVPAATDAIGIENTLGQDWRAIVALAIIYGAFLAEIFRAGIESIPAGQMEAARSVGMSYYQAMRHIILPQAIRNISPALGNDFIAMLKDSSLVSVLAVRDLTQMGRLYAGSTFRFRESYLVLTFFYLSMTIALSLLLRWYERRLKRGRN